MESLPGFIREARGHSGWNVKVPEVVTQGLMIISVEAPIINIGDPVQNIFQVKGTFS